MTPIGRLRPYRTLRLAARLSSARARAAHGKARRTQEKVLARILSLYRDTELGHSLGLGDVRSIADFQRRIPVTEKVDYASWVERLQRDNAPGIVTKKRLKYLALTSGTNDELRHFPFPAELIKAFQQFQLEIMLHLMDRLQRYNLLDQNVLVTAPAATYDKLPSGLVVGKATAIMTQLTPRIGRGLVRPPRSILEMTDVEAKLTATVKDAIPRDIRLLTGVPLSVLPLAERILDEARAQGLGASTLGEIWPNLAAYTYSGAAIGSLEPRLRELIGEGIPFFEVYSASESPLAYQFVPGEPGLLLDVRHTFFEFQRAGDPLESPRLTLEQVEPSTPYRILLTTLGGRFCYRLGDHVEFLSTDPYLIRVLGREREELNLGYERIPLHVVKSALARACEVERARIHNFFVCPTERSETEPGHEWHIEFAEPPESTQRFLGALDQALLESHDRYAFARKDDHLLRPPELVVRPVGTVERFVLEAREFGLAKFTPIFNERRAAAPILEFASAQESAPAPAG
jgi:hypothetical protein